jgi:nitroreductase
MNISKQQIIDGFKFRHATKEFDSNKKISKEDFDFILETARLSPSSFGLEPWNILVIQDQELRNELRQYAWGAQGQLPTASHFVILTAKTEASLKSDSNYFTHIMRDIQHITEDSIEKRKNRYNEYLKNDAKLLDSSRGVLDWSGRQAYIALANMMTSATLIGIDSCPIEGFDTEQINSILQDKGLTDSKYDQVIVMVAFGYRSHQPEWSKTRRPITEIVKWY